MPDTDPAAPAATMSLDQMREAVAAADAAAAAERQAKADAATAAMRALVVSPEFKAALPVMEAALEQAPKVQELTYAVNMMERLRDTYTVA